MTSNVLTWNQQNTHVSNPFHRQQQKDDFVVLLQCTTRKNGFINEEFEKKIVNVGIILFSQKRRQGIISMDNLFLKII